MVWTLNPWQMLLWIIGLELLSLPLIVAAANSIINAYYKAKEAHHGRILNALSKTIDEVTKTMKKRTDERVEKLRMDLDKLDVSELLNRFHNIKKSDEPTVTVTEDDDSEE